MTQKSDFFIGAVAGSFIWFLFISSGGTIPDVASPIDPFLADIVEDTNALKSFIFYVLVGGVLSVVLSPFVEKFKRRGGF